MISARASTLEEASVGPFRTMPSRRPVATRASTFTLIHSVARTFLWEEDNPVCVARYLLSGCHMAKFDTSITDFASHNFKRRNIMRQAFGVAVYLGIVAVFASVTFIAWLISLVVW
jgi:hypothetical protein